VRRRAGADGIRCQPAALIPSIMQMHRLDRNVHQHYEGTQDRLPVVPSVFNTLRDKK